MTKQDKINDIINLLKSVYKKVRVSSIVDVLKDKYNAELFVGDNGLSNTVWRLPELTTEYEEKKVMGYFFYDLWQSKTDESVYYFVWGRMGNTRSYKMVIE